MHRVVVSSGVFRPDPDKRGIDTFNPKPLNYPSNFIILPENNNHPDLLFSIRRLNLEDVHQAAYRRACGNLLTQYPDEVVNGISTRENTVIYKASISQGKAVLSEIDNSLFIPNLMQTGEVISLLIKVINNPKLRVYDGNGSQIKNEVLDAVVDDIMGARDPLRGDYIDARFSYDGKSKEGLVVHWTEFDKSRNHLFNSPRLPKWGKQSWVRQNFYADAEPYLYWAKQGALSMDPSDWTINLEKWLRNPTRQGLPKKGTKHQFRGGDGTYSFLQFILNYRAPMEDKLSMEKNTDTYAAILINGGGLILNCQIKDKPYGYIGIRPMRVK